MLLFYYALECIGLKDLARSAKEILKRAHRIDVESKDGAGDGGDDGEEEKKKKEEEEWMKAIESDAKV